MAIAHPMPMNEGVLLPSDLTKKGKDESQVTHVAS